MVDAVRAYLVAEALHFYLGPGRKPIRIRAMRMPAKKPSRPRPKRAPAPAAGKATNNKNVKGSNPLSADCRLLPNGHMERPIATSVVDINAARMVN